MYRKLLCVVAISVFAALAISAGADPALEPWTGTGTLPTAELQQQGSAALAVDFLDYDDYDADWYYDFDYSAYPTRLVYGLSNRLELGAGFVDDYSDTWKFAAKYQFQSDESGSTAFGAYYSTADSYERPWFDSWGYSDMYTVPEEEVYNLYVARTFSLGEPRPEGVSQKITVGANWTMVSWDEFEFPYYSRDEWDEAAFRLFASWQAHYGRGLLAFDYQSRDKKLEQEPMWSAVVRYDISPNLKAEAGYGNGLGLRGTEDSRFFGGLCFTLGR